MKARKLPQLSRSTTLPDADRKNTHLQDNETDDQPPVTWDRGHKPPPMMEVLPAGSDVWVQVRVVQTREDQIMVKYPGASEHHRFVCILFECPELNAKRFAQDRLGCSGVCTAAD